MIEALKAPLNLDLRPFSRYLATQGLCHRISEESGMQVLYVSTDTEGEAVREAFVLWRERPELLDELNQQWEQQRRPSPGLRDFANGVIRQLYYLPITSILTILCLLVAAVTLLGSRLNGVEFLFYPLLETGGVLPLLLDIDSFAKAIQTLSPMLLHFGGIHLAFNLLWLWYFGRQLEPSLPRFAYVSLIVLLAFISNTAQYLVLSYNNFGGMSGVVYGLVGYAWIVHVLFPTSRLQINNTMFAVFVIMMVLMEVFVGSFIATTAHVGGLVAGLLLGLVAVGYYRAMLNRE